MSGTTVLLFFTGIKQPLVAKVEIANEQNSETEIFITFVSTGQKIIIKGFRINQFVPEQTSEERK